MAETDDLEDLLADTLKDFDDQLQTQPPFLQQNSHAEPSASQQPGTSITAGSDTQPKSSAKGLGLGLSKGGLPARPGSAAAGKQPRARLSATATAQQAEGAAQLPPDIQRLADDLIRLVEESGIGERMNNGITICMSTCHTWLGQVWVHTCKRATGTIKHMQATCTMRR